MTEEAGEMVNFAAGNSNHPVRGLRDSPVIMSATPCPCCARSSKGRCAIAATSSAELQQVPCMAGLGSSQACVPAL